MTDLKAMNDAPQVVVRKDGDMDAVFAASARVLEVDYEFPYLAHGAMEPLDIAVLFDGENAEFWFGSQIQTVDHQFAAGTLGIDFANVKINTLWAGGSFGRRAQFDAHPVVEISLLAKAMLAAGMKPQPVKIVFTREDDMEAGYYRPMSAHTIKVGLDEDGAVTGFHYDIAAKSLLKGTIYEEMMIQDGVDHNMTEGAHDTTYGFPVMNMNQSYFETRVPVLWWRSVGHTHTAYVMETMMDRLAKEAGKDPVAYRLEMLKDDPRKAAVLRAGRREGRLGYPGNRRQVPWRRSPQVLRYLCGPGRRDLVPRRWHGQGREGHLRCRLRRCGQSRQCQGPDGRRAWLRPRRHPAQRGDDDRRHCRPDQLRHLRAAAHHRHARGRGAYRRVRRSPDRHGRAGHSADRTGRRKRNRCGQGCVGHDLPLSKHDLA